MHHVRMVQHLAILIVIWATSLSPAAAQHRPTHDAARDLTQGWEYRWGDSPVDDQGIPLWAQERIDSSGWTPYSFSSPPADRQGRQTLWMRVQLPESVWPTPSLYLTEILVAGEIYLSGEPIYHNGILGPDPANKHRTSLHHLVPLPSDVGGRWLTILIYSNYDEVIGLMDPPRIGNQADLIRESLWSVLDQLIFGVLFIFLGPAALILYLRRRDQQLVEYLSFGAFTTCVGVVFLLGSSAINVHGLPAAWQYYLDHVCFFLFPIGLYAFFEQILGGGPYGLMRRIWQFHALFALAGVLLDVTDVIALPILQFYLLGLLAVGVAFTLWMVIGSEVRRQTEARILSAGVSLLVLAGLHDIAAVYGLIPYWHQVFPWGVLALVICLGYAVERRFMENHRRLVLTTEDLRSEIVVRKQAEASLKEANAEVERLNERLKTENIYLQEEIKLDHNFGEIITQSEPLKAVLRQVEQVASTDATVLVLGETGTGKELLARAVHSISGRRDRPLVKVNCAALPANLIESELFGHEKGAFTGALARKTGRFELADGGTIFLDEIGDLPLDLQVKLLRVLQEGEFERLGSSTTLSVDVRVIAATNRNLDQAMRDGEFREDLFYRLNVFPIVCPPLRDHRDDIPLLVIHFVKKFAAKAGKSIETVPQPVMDTFAQYNWPGNVRELENLVERAVVISDGPQLKVQELLSDRVDSPNQSSIPTLADLERDHIASVLDMTGGRIRGDNGAAEILGLKPTTLESRMERLGIKRRS